MPKKIKIPPNNGGMNANEKDRYRKACRQVWQWTSHARKLCLKRALTEEGFSRCENPDCNKIVPKCYADHIIPVGDVDDGFWKRLTVSSEELQAFCKKCHDKKTKQERAELKRNNL